MRRQKLRLTRFAQDSFKAFGVVFSYALATLIISVYSCSLVSAGGAIGPGGSGGGGSGGHQSSYGYGWYVYDLSSSGPADGFRDGTPWSSVISSCQTHSTQAAVFIVLNAKSSAMGYNYEGWTNVRTTTGYLTLSNAKAAYDSLDSSLKTGFTWGSNVGWFCYGSAPPPPPPPPPAPLKWDAASEAYVDKPDVYPGDEVKYSYILKNVGPIPFTRLEWHTTGGSGGNAPYMKPGDRVDPLPGYETFTIPNDAAPGPERYCRQIWHQNSEEVTNYEYAKVCVRVKSNYDVYPGVTGGGSDYQPVPLTPGSSLPLTGVAHNKTSIADRDIQYEMHQFVVKSGSSPNKPDFSSTFTSTKDSYKYTTTTHNNGQACTSWMAGSFPMISGCNQLAAGALSTMPTGAVTLAVRNINADDYNPGDWVCVFVSVGMYKYNVTSAVDHRVSHPICVIITKRPTVQIWGHDARVGNGYTTTMLNPNAYVKTVWATANTKGRTYGSWAEYGIFAPSNGTITSASGGALSGKDGQLGIPTDTQRNNLSFANTTSPYGRWAPPSILMSVLDAASKLPKVADITQASVVLQSAAAGVGAGEVKVVPLHAPAGQRTVRLSGEIPRGAGVIVIADATVVIDGNITTSAADQTITELGGASQLVIIAPNIIVQNNVDTVDAWLAAIPTTRVSSDGVISTCDAITDPYYAGLTVSDDCSKRQLRVNGAVFAREVQFRRTYGSQKDSMAVPAEVINLRADAYMWGKGTNLANLAGGTPIETTLTSELPPRF